MQKDKQANDKLQSQKQPYIHFCNYLQIFEVIENNLILRFAKQLLRQLQSKPRCTTNTGWIPHGLDFLREKIPLR